jgi:ABC-type amino acid transport substrate-binding protein
MILTRKHLFALAGAAGLGALAPRGAAAQAALERIRRQGALRVAITPTAVGFNWKDAATNQLIGVNVEVARRFAREIGVNPEFIEMPFPALFEHMLSGRSDIVMSAVVVRPDRASRFNFSVVPYSFGFSAIVRAGETRRFANMQAVVEEYRRSGLRIGEQTNSAFVAQLREAGVRAADISLYENKQDAIRDVGLGRIEITFWDTPIAQNFLHNNPQLAQRVRLAPEFSSPKNDNAYPIRFEDTDLLEFVNRVLRAMIADGSLAAAMRQFGMNPDDLIPKT